MYKRQVYIRLSAEDDNVDGRAKKESDSVTSQRILLKSFVIDELGVVESDIPEYVDDGVSGTHFTRQGFQQLQDDMKSGEIGCVVVKDFSDVYKRQGLRTPGSCCYAFLLVYF